MLIRLYHGTSKTNFEKLRKDGATKLYLTLDDEQANYYAECASEDDNTEPVIVIVEVPVDMLQADLPSFDEPLTYILEYNKLDSEKNWHEAIKDGFIQYPEKFDWKTSLKFTQNVIAIGNIKPEQIFEGDLEEKDIEFVNNLLNENIKAKNKP